MEAMHGWLGSMTVMCTPLVRLGKWQVEFHRPGTGDPEINIDQSKNLLEVERGNDLLAALCIAYAFDKALCQPLVTIIGYQEKEHMDDDDDSLDGFDAEQAAAMANADSNKPRGLDGKPPVRRPRKALPAGDGLDPNAEFYLQDEDYEDETDPDSEGYYDEDGNWIEGYYDEEGTWIEGYYDKDGNWVEKSRGYYDEDGNYVPLQGYYDEHGNFIEGEAQHDKDGNLLEGEYEDSGEGYYDEQGNYIEGKEPRDPHPEETKYLESGEGYEDDAEGGHHHDPAHGEHNEDEDEDQEEDYDDDYDEEDDAHDGKHAKMAEGGFEDEPETHK